MKLHEYAVLSMAKTTRLVSGVPLLVTIQSCRLPQIRYFFQKKLHSITPARSIWFIWQSFFLFFALTSSIAFYNYFCFSIFYACCFRPLLFLCLLLLLLLLTFSQAQVTEPAALCRGVLTRLTHEFAETAAATWPVAAATTTVAATAAGAAPAPHSAGVSRWWNLGHAHTRRICHVSRVDRDGFCCDFFFFTWPWGCATTQFMCANDKFVGREWFVPLSSFFYALELAHASRPPTCCLCSQCWTRCLCLPSRADVAIRIS